MTSKGKGLSIPKLTQLLQTLGSSFTSRGRTKEELLLLARENNLITPAQFDESLPNKFLAKKCYLFTLIKDDDIRNRIDEYVQVYSLFWTRAHYLLNFMVHRISGVPLYRPQKTNDKTFVLWSPTTLTNQTPAHEIYSKFLEKKSPGALCQIFIPERYPTQRKQLDLDIRTCFDVHRSDLNHLFPECWEQVMSRSGWDSVCSYAAQLMRTTFRTYIRTSTVRCAKAYVKMLMPGHEKRLLSLLCNPLPKNKPLEINQDIYDHILVLRHVFGIKNDGWLPSLAYECTPDLVDLHLFFARTGFLKRPMAPVSTLGRKHAYLEERVVKALFPNIIKNTRGERTSGNFMSAIGFSPEAFVREQNQKRRKLKKWTGKKMKKVREKWKKRGMLKIPRNSIVRSALTDGVSLVLRFTMTSNPPSLADFGLEGEDLSNPSDLPKRRLKKRLIDEVDGSTLEGWREDDTCDPVFVGVDGGRAKIYTATVDKGQSFETRVYTRSKHYFKMGHKRRMKKVNKRRTKNQALDAALKALSVAGESNNLLVDVHAQQNHSAVLRREYIEAKIYVKNKMRGYRYKKSTLTKASNDLLDVRKGPGQRTVIGYGDAGFPSSGRGERSVPVKGIVLAIKESINRRRHQLGPNWNDQIVLVPIDEYRTTKACCDCEEDTEPFKLPKKENKPQRTSSRLRYCAKCNKLRDRDIQASRNILEILKAKYYGDPRPSRFKRQRPSPGDGPEEGAPSGQDPSTVEHGSTPGFAPD